MKILLVTGQSNGKQTGYILKSMLEKIGVGVLNCAVGGSEVVEWQKGQPHYMSALQAVLDCQQNGDEIIGMFHMQGEAESGNALKAAKWKTLTLKFFRQFRVQCGLPDLPIVYAQIGPKPTDLPRLFWGMVQNKQAALTAQYPEFEMIVTQDIVPYEPVPGPHWGKPGYREITHRVYEKFFGGTNEP